MDTKWLYTIGILLMIGIFIGIILLYKANFYEVTIIEGKAAELVDIKTCEGDYVKKEIIRDGNEVKYRVYVMKKVKNLLLCMIPVASLVVYSTIMSLILLRRYDLSMENVFRRTIATAILVYTVQSVTILLGSASTDFHGLRTMTDLYSLCTVLGIIKLFETIVILYLSPILKAF